VSHRSDLARRVLGALALVWIGLLLGVDLIAAPAPFRAEGLERLDALVVNRELFGATSRSELVLLVLTVICMAIGGLRPVALMILVALAVVVALQALWLLPALAARTDVFLAGGDPGPASFHGLYVGLEAVKLLLLAGLAAVVARKGTKKPPGDGTG
jgi:hypothetical protein